MKRFPLIFGILLLLAATPATVTGRQPDKNWTVVIDPGHGGKAPGAIGRQAREKDITLAISLQLGEYIREHMPDVEVIFTRETDVSVGLRDRAQIANEIHADLFISIHANSTSSPRAKGTETFVMGLHRSQDNLEVAKRENKAILYEDDYEETYDGFDPDSPEANIIFALYQNAHLEQSLEIASLVQRQFRDRARRIDRGVKQAGFLVLYNLTMPSILVETGFLSHPAEEAYLMSETGQAHIASGIFRAFREYKENQDVKDAARNQYPLAETRYSENEPRTQEITDSVSFADSNQQGQGNNSDISFRVQFAASSGKKDPDDSSFNGLRNVSWYHHEGLYKYTVGNETTLEEAARIQQKVQEAGFKEAFVVAFRNNERISASEAIRLLSNEQEQ
ncbi:MAG: N-acetylmuramoyl-L-alanine amidase [Bacteroidales bacterium]